MELKDFIADWVFTYLKNKDIVVRKIVSIEKLQDSLLNFKIIYKDKIQYIISMEKLEGLPDMLSKKSKEDGAFLFIATINSKKNFDFLVQNWMALSNKNNLTICFINPFSLTETKWNIQPFTHNKIAEAGSLNAGLKTVFETVEVISEEEFNKRIKNPTS